MKINADFDKRVVVHSEQMAWVDSPMFGVARRPLDRIGAEAARATSIVKYAPGSYFSRHIHMGGKEFLVLDGVFQEVSIEFWDANTEIEHCLTTGAEILVLEGQFYEAGDTLVKHSWLRLPVDTQANIKTGPEPTKVWIKRGHLGRVEKEQARLANQG